MSSTDFPSPSNAAMIAPVLVPKMRLNLHGQWASDQGFNLHERAERVEALRTAAVEA